MIERKPPAIPPDLDIVRHPTARRCTLSFDPASGRARLVIPKRAALKPALAWAAEIGRAHV